MAPTEYLHHYTTIENLALILSSKKLRFNRLDKVNDIMESERYGELDLSKHIYISCWTDSIKESIPLWNLYSEMKGVRITLPVDPFKYQKLESGNVGDSYYGVSDTLSFLPVNEMFSTNYIVNPIIFQKKR